MEQQKLMPFLMLFHVALFCMLLLQQDGQATNGMNPSKNKSSLLDSLFESMKPGESLRTNVEADLGPNCDKQQIIFVQIPLVLLKGIQPAGPRLVIWSGVHGGEFMGIEATQKFVSLVDPKKLTGQLVLCLIANPPAVFNGRLNLSPLDQLNLNREFPGNADGKPTQRLAHWLRVNLLFGADAFIDMHSGGIDQRLVPFLGYRKAGFDPGVDERARQLAYAIGFANIAYSCSATDGNSHAEAARLGIPAVLVEMGELGECRNEAKVNCSLHGLFSALVHLKMLEHKDRDRSVSFSSKQQCSTLGDNHDEKAVEIQPIEWIWEEELKSDTEGLWSPEFQNGYHVHIGQTLGHVQDVLTGETVQTVTSLASGRVFYSMNALTVHVGSELVQIARLAGSSSTNNTC